MAAVNVTVQLKGLRELDAMLARLPDELEDAIMSDALKQAGDVVLQAARANIHSRTGKTAADLRLEVQVTPGKHEGAGAIGGTRRGRDGRQHVLRWLEFGAQPHKIVAGEKAKRLIKKGMRRAVRNRDIAGAIRIAKLSRGVARALKLPGGTFRAGVNHPGIKNQSPLTRALFENGHTAIKVYGDALWRGVVRLVRSMPKAA